MRVAILHNPRPQTPDPDAPDDAYEEYDSAETIAAIGAALRCLGVEPEPLIADRQLPSCLAGQRFDFIFNIAEGEAGCCREAIPAAVSELSGIPYTGSDPLTLAVTLDKWIARRIVSPDVPVPRGVLVDLKAGEPDLEQLRYPLIVKPNGEGSSKGIWRESLCADQASAAARCHWLSERYGCPALVEEFLSGAEVTVGVTGNGCDSAVPALMEIAPASGADGPFLYSVEVKRDWRRRVQYRVPPRLSPAQLETIRDYALSAYRLLGCRDVARIDFRLDTAGQPFFLECNPLPGLNPDSSDLAIMSRGILPYERLVQGILLDAVKRVGVSIA